jgi:hypothetical protein
LGDPYPFLKLSFNYELSFPIEMDRSGFPLQSAMHHCMVLCSISTAIPIARYGFRILYHVLKHVASVEYFLVQKLYFGIPI